MGLLDRLFGTRSSIAEIDLTAFAAALNDPNVQVVDCRTEREWRSGHIQGARLMSLGSLRGQAGELDPERPVIVVCKSGHRSGIAARQLSGAGCSDVKSLAGGVDAWRRAGKPLVK